MGLLRLGEVRNPVDMRNTADTGAGSVVGTGLAPVIERCAELGDLRFRTLLGEEGWMRLPPAVRRRFSKRLDGNDVALYRGEVVATHLSVAGRVLAAALRIVGAPLPMHDNARGAAVVAVSEDAALGGQTWVRIYARPGHFPQVVHSAKRFRGPTGLEEHIGHGIGMCLDVGEEAGAIVFRSNRYFLDWFGTRFWLPKALTPGDMEIIHREEDAGRFSFRLKLSHPRFGLLVEQTALFEDV